MSSKSRIRKSHKSRIRSRSKSRIRSKSTTYPFYKLKMPSNRETLIKTLRKMALYWEKLTTRNEDMSLERLRSESITDLKKFFVNYTSKEAYDIWLKWVR